MGYGFEAKSALGGSVAFPMLLECDLRGQVLWMSDRTRSILGGVDNLVKTIECEARGGGPGRRDPARPLRFTCILAAGERVFISAEREAEATVPEQTWSLLHLNGSMMRHCFDLQTAERNLFIILRGRCPGGARRVAVRQIELERQRLGRELHGGVGQMLAAIRLQLEVVVSQVPDPPAPVGRAFDRISTLASDALEQVRAISHRLHPPEWQRLTLESALRQLWDISGIPEKYQASLLIRPLPQEPDLEIKVLMYRAAQEALSNLTRHSRATRIQMSLGASAGKLTLTVQDDGVGFDVARLFSAPPSVASGIGLRSIRDQAEVLGGRLAIDSSAAGTRLEVSAPFQVVER